MLYYFKKWCTIVIKDGCKSAAALIWRKEDCMKVYESKFGDNNIYEEVLNNFKKLVCF